MTRLFGWALALSMIAGVAAYAVDCCCDPGMCTGSCCHHCNRAAK